MIFVSFERENASPLEEVPALALGGKPRDEDTEGGNQPADKSLINRRLSLRSQLCAAKALFAGGHLTARALDCVRVLDGEHKN
jgi:hypothetical protein